MCGFMLADLEGCEGIRGLRGLRGLRWRHITAFGATVLLGYHESDEGKALKAKKQPCCAPQHGWHDPK